MRGKAVIVLGMSRTGTSAAARLLNLAGVDLGRPEQLIGPVEGQNPKGFYENRPIMLVNEELLRRLGGSWSHPPSLEPGWQSRSEFDELRDRARGLLAENFSEVGCVGLQGPAAELDPAVLARADRPDVVCRVSPQRSRGGGITAAARRPSDSRGGCAVGAVLLERDRQHGRNAPHLHRLRGAADRPGARARPTSPNSSASKRSAHDPALLAAAREWIAPDLRHHTSELSEVMASRDVPPGARSLQLALDLAVHARQEEDALRGRATAGPISDALTALGGELASVPPADRAAAAPPALARGSAGGCSTRSRRGFRADRGARGGLADGRSAAARPADRARRRNRRRACARPRRRAAVDGRRREADPARSRRIWPRPHPGPGSWPSSRTRSSGRSSTIVTPRAAGSNDARLARALREQLCPGALAGARAAPSPTNGYIISGRVRRDRARLPRRVPAGRADDRPRGGPGGVRPGAVVHWARRCRGIKPRARRRRGRIGAAAR